MPTPSTLRMPWIHWGWTPAKHEYYNGLFRKLISSETPSDLNLMLPADHLGSPRRTSSGDFLLHFPPHHPFSTWPRVKFSCVCVCMCVCVLSRSVKSDSSRPHRLQPTRLLCPWDFPGKSTGVVPGSSPGGSREFQGWKALA